MRRAGWPRPSATDERRRSSRNVVSDVEIDDFEGPEKTYVRHFVFDERHDQVLAANMASLGQALGLPPAEVRGVVRREPGLLSFNVSTLLTKFSYITQV